jgi:hypothetical protein
MNNRIGMALLAATAAFTLPGCTTGDYGYGGVSLGYNSGYYGDPYWGWYDNYYYPGTGYYIYDRGGGRHYWNDSQRHYWEGRRGSRQASGNWSGYRGGLSGAAGQSSQAQHQHEGASGQSWQQQRQASRAQNQAQGRMQAPQQSGMRGWSGRGNPGHRESWSRGN